MPHKRNSPEMKDKNDRNNMRTKIRQCIISCILDNGMWPREQTVCCGNSYYVDVKKNARLVMKHKHTGLTMVYEAHTGDSYTLHPEKKTVFYTKAKGAHNPTESMRNATKYLHVENGWLPDEFKNNELMVLSHAASLTF